MAGGRDCRDFTHAPQYHLRYLNPPSSHALFVEAERRFVAFDEPGTALTASRCADAGPLNRVVQR
jgi:hypothetical protein